MAEHTPLPWHVGSTNHTELVMGFRDNIECVVSESDPEIDMPMDEAEANAAFIVKACNSHEALVKALTYAQVDLSAARDLARQVLGEPHGLNQTIAIVEAALLAAREVKP